MPDRVCIECGAAYSPNASRKCGKCRQPLKLKPCTECGKGFKGSALRCSTCRTVAKTCECGAAFRARGHTKCYQCRARERECTGCGRLIISTAGRCHICQAVERACVDCGKAFRGAIPRCNSCNWTANVSPEYLARVIAASNRRRAVKRAAEVAGPVPAEVYLRLRAEPECVYCAEPTTEIDHVRPLDQGGWEHESNLVPSCTPCNRSKGPRLLIEWNRERALHGAQRSEKVAAELNRLLKVVSA